MSKYIIRLDDASEKRNIDNWDRMENLLDNYDIKPLVGVVPNCKDSEMKKYSTDNEFWNKVDSWISKGYSIAMHGYEHLYTTECGGINPVNHRSEFAGETLEIQKKKIRNGVNIMRSHGIEPEIFFAPSHTFDENTITALKQESNIKIISDTVANKPYSMYGMTFVPQQSGRARKLPFNTVTFCYHPNDMKNNDFELLEEFIKKNKKYFISFPKNEVTRKKSLLDKFLSKIYFAKR